MTDREQRLWESKRITSIQGTFEEFVESLDATITSPFRGIVVTPQAVQLPIAQRFNVRDPDLSSICLEFLENDVEYIHSGMPIEDLQPKLFYRGYSPRWAAVEQDLDARRDIEEQILLDIVLDQEHVDGSQFYCIKGPAGSGKTVLLQRLAWETAVSLEKLCLLVRPNSTFNYEVLKELHAVAKERIYLFIDDIDESVTATVRLLEQCQGDDFDITIVAAARFNEWNISCTSLDVYLDQDFELKHLSTREIDSILRLLQTNNALYRLQQSTLSERREAFVERAGRQLLVALHEATLGSSFEDIVADEFARISPPKAQTMYLGICFLNRLDVPVRAGLISRVFGIRFTDFRERFFSPLQEVVFSRYDRRVRDTVYVTRHPHIAEIVVDRVLQDRDATLAIYLKLIEGMNVDYSSDHKAFRKLIRGRSLLAEFPDHEMSQKVYLAAAMKSGSNSYLLHQRAVNEMNRNHGSLELAATYLAQAREQAPNDRTITHSLAELYLRLATSASTDLKFHINLRRAFNLAQSLTGRTAFVSHGYHTLAKIGTARLRRELQSFHDLDEARFSRLVEDVESVIQDGLQKFPDDSYLLSAESDLRQLLQDDETAIEALETAFKNSPQNPFIAVRLARILTENSRIEDAETVYRTALNAGGFDKKLHFNFAKLMIDHTSGSGADIEYHLRRSFTDGDANTEAQFWYARQLYVDGQIPASQARFQQLKKIVATATTKHSLRGTVCTNGEVDTFSGTVEDLQFSFGFVIRDGVGDKIFLHARNIDSSVWDRLSRNARILFSIAFNFLGATATDVRLG